MNIDDILTEIIDEHEVISFKEIIEKLKQFLKKYNRRGHEFIFSNKDELNVLSRCNSAELMYKGKNNVKITNLHKASCFCYALFEDIATGYPIKIKGLPEDAAEQITSFSATFIAFNIIQADISEDDIKIIAIGFLDLFKRKKLTIDIIVSHLDICINLNGNSNRSNNP
jgi:hypothetical protein